MELVVNREVRLKTINSTVYKDVNRRYEIALISLAFLGLEL